jgi:hypothetical protein
MASEHAKALEAARKTLVKHRRRVAGNLVSHKGASQSAREADEFTDLQAATEAIDRGIEDEEEQEAHRQAAARPRPE